MLQNVQDKCNKDFIIVLCYNLTSSYIKRLIYKLLIGFNLVEQGNLNLVYDENSASLHLRQKRRIKHNHNQVISDEHFNISINKYIHYL